MPERAGSAVTEVPGSHSVYLSQPAAVAALITQAAAQPEGKQASRGSPESSHAGAAGRGPAAPAWDDSDEPRLACLPSGCAAAWVMRAATAAGWDR